MMIWQSTLLTKFAIEFLVFGAFPLEAKATRDTVFVIANRGGSITIGAECAMTLYTDGSLGTVYDSAKKADPSAVFEVPEYVSALKQIYRLQKARDEEARLYLRGRDRDRVAAAPRDRPLPEFEKEVQNRRIIERVSVYDYDFLVWKNDGPGASGWDSVPDVLIRSNGRHYLTYEINLTSAVNWIITVTPLMDPRARSQLASRDDFRRHTVFELVPARPTEAEEVARWSVVAREWTDLDSSAGGTERRLFLYVTPEADASRSYGHSIASLLVRDSDEPRLPDAEAVLIAAMKRAWSAANLEEQKAVHLRKHHDFLDRQEHRRTAPMEKRLADAYHGVSVLTRGLLDRNARLLATIDGGVGHIHFFWNPPEAIRSPGKVVHVVVQEEEGLPRLGDSFDGHDAAVSEIFATPEFKEGLIDYLKIKHRDVLEKAGYPLP